ncbi:TPA: phage portal protein, partial [Pseudomonas aeruginosa]|nr:phage portal protein [Pseudomonas aeruginosa]HCF1395679.1 phage portal protein [Pseudomonas aeruginosa]
NNGMMTRDEARAKENLPLKGGNADVLTVQTALIPIDQLGKTPAGN